MFSGCEKKQDQPQEPAAMDTPQPGNGAPDLLEDRPPRPNRQGSAKINFFYMESCPSCDEYVLAETIRDTFIEAQRKGYLPWSEVSFSSSNILTEGQVEELDQFLRDEDLPAVGLSLPLLVINDSIVVGYDEIEILLESLLDY